ncbi:unnamed protein product (macronuclear) [Paramecium tetraurelia]|uniref:Uncharacterized protein n=1 Tax=Paramecium tetraurelia TaxID=5888 RepID=A0D6U0_PARTE|nr:uncharacterized protein GSPATT00001798001 [Paramecium tetraurelia]CAK78757.1 unnamed protein product [Paramecium tetraurelia]|eukprot:XP_001446154.1 hypothetical protein (macronuclear) [Paramecium tetraurelia strain d4-2]
MNKRANLGDNQKRLTRILNQIKELVNDKGESGQKISDINSNSQNQFSKEEMIKFIKMEYQQLCQEVQNLQVYRKKTFGSPPRDK